MLAYNNKNVKHDTIKSLLKWAFLALKKTSLSPMLDAEVILSYTIGKNKEYLYAHPEKVISKTKTDKFKRFIARRKKYEPVAYITGQKEFYGLKLKVNKDVLIPRPETELIVEEVLKIIKRDSMKNTSFFLIDVGTGSGCIPIAIAKNLEIKLLTYHKDKRELDSLRSLTPIIYLCANDVSRKALSIASKNAKENNISEYINFFKGNLLKNIERNESYKTHTLDYIGCKNTIFITANLPYLPEAIYKKCPRDVRMYEPKDALVAGKDGLKYYRRLFREIKFLYSPAAYKEKIILCEIYPSQSKAIKNLVKKYFPDALVQIKKDLAGLDRIAFIKI